MTTNSITCNLRDERLASLALLEADKSTMKHHQHGCIAVAGGQILARGTNSYRCQSNDGYLTDTCSCHAEIDVLRKLERILAKKHLPTSNRNNVTNGNHSAKVGAFYGRISIYVVRRGVHGNSYKNSAPCIRCAYFMKSLNIKNVIYSNSYGKLTKCKIQDYTTTHTSQGSLFTGRCTV